MEVQSLIHDASVCLDFISSDIKSCESPVGDGVFTSWLHQRHTSRGRTTPSPHLGDGTRRLQLRPDDEMTGDDDDDSAEGLMIRWTAISNVFRTTAPSSFTDTEAKICFHPEMPDTHSWAVSLQWTASFWWAVASLIVGCSGFLSPSGISGRCLICCHWVLFIKVFGCHRQSNFSYGQFSREFLGKGRLRLRKRLFRERILAGWFLDW